ncbi:ubiquitin-associated protein 1-like isoform X1 [Asterias rubens]|uniref:ubiquitin-associated protein 1-like isoform X1 n=1 Tax=Asterias rubens TaxID=7604 RepID=UPI001455651C|nr:ubiquitin-associated protein 1-like isoform X1 [Asterias rubens]XP_033634453.1 ubiquitin-associated protein 1-like isoform X1 [Asterias rubens]
MAYHYQTSLGRSLSVTSLQGIQVRLGERFKPPEKVSLPLGYKEPNPSAALNATQYSLETESTFLQWLNAKKVSDAAKEASRRQALEEQKAAATSPAQLPNGILQPTDAKGSSSEPPTNSIPPIPSLGSGGILTPETLATSSSRLPVAPVNRKRMYDLADFENNASDPFESTELETLNDMEELKSVLANTNVPVRTGGVRTEQPLHSPDLSEETEPASSEVTELASVIVQTSNKQVSYKPDKPKPVSKPTGLSTGPNTQVPNGSKIPSTSSTPNINPDPFGRSPLPPIHSSRSDSQVSPQESNDRLISRGLAATNSSQPQRGRSPPPNYYAPDFTSSRTSPVVSPVEPPPGYPQCVSLEEVSCSSYPDLDLENLNRYTPLPPPPHQSHVTALDFGQSPVPDPIFDNLSAEDRAFVANIAAMGFPRSRTARAVQQLGHDDRIVVEWLCSVDHLCSQRFPEDKVEIALSLQNNNRDKALEFLHLWQRFEELGFKSEDIRRELIVHGNNENEVLNVLMAKS